MNIEQAKFILGLSNKFTDEELKKAYRDKSKKYHPDINHTEEAEEMMKKINSAVEILKKIIGAESFEEYKQSKIDKINKMIKKNDKMSFQNCSSKFLRLYSTYFEKEKEIYKEFLKALESSKDKLTIENLESAFNLEINKNISNYVNQLFECYKVSFNKLQFSEELKPIFEDRKQTCMSASSINKALNSYIDSTKILKQQNFDKLDGLKESMENSLNSIIDKYNSIEFYSKIESKIGKLKDSTLSDFSMEIEGLKNSEDIIDVRAMLKRRLQKFESRLEKLIKSYELFFEEKQKKLDYIFECKQKCGEEFSVLFDSYIRELEKIDDQDEFKKTYEKINETLCPVISEKNKFKTKEDFIRGVYDTKNDLMFKFNLKVANASIEDINKKSDILSRALVILNLILDNKISADNIKYIKRISFDDYLNDKIIVDFIYGIVSPELLSICSVPNFDISDDKLLKLYKRIKPIVNEESRYYMIREFVLEELRNKSLETITKDDIRESILSSSLYPVGQFECVHTIKKKDSFIPVVSEVLSQIPDKYVLETTKFEIVSKAPIIVKNGFPEGETYHKSLVKLYK